MATSANAPLYRRACRSVDFVLDLLLVRAKAGIEIRLRRSTGIHRALELAFVDVWRRAKLDEMRVADLAIPRANDGGQIRVLHSALALERGIARRVSVCGRYDNRPAQRASADWRKASLRF